jgi:4-hydroxy-tetrahydrodipicolinate reductase
MGIRICVAGATGKVGRGLVQAIREADDLELVSAISRTYQGQDLGQVLHHPAPGLRISGSVAEALDAPADVLLDYTKPDAVKQNVLTAVERGVHVVVGTSGLSDEDYAEIDRQARQKAVGVLAAGNFAITAVLLQRFAMLAAKYIPQWEIIDYGSAGKVDAPSGTTRELAYRLSQVREPFVQVPVENTFGAKESRGVTLNGSQIHSLRLPGFVVSAEVIFAQGAERLSIRHDSVSDTAPYVAGTLLAARKVGALVGLHRGLDSVLEF